MKTLGEKQIDSKAHYNLKSNAADILPDLLRELLDLLDSPSITKILCSILFS